MLKTNVTLELPESLLNKNKTEFSSSENLSVQQKDETQENSSTNLSAKEQNQINKNESVKKSAIKVGASQTELIKKDGPSMDMRRLKKMIKEKIDRIGVNTVPQSMTLEKLEEMKSIIKEKEITLSKFDEQVVNFIIPDEVEVIP